MKRRIVGLKCIKCGTEYPISKLFNGCPSCRTDKFVSNLIVTYDYEAISSEISKDLFLKRPKELGVWRYKELLPVENEKHMITLGEGNTQLIRAKNLEKKLHLRNLYIKNESTNPTWSYKDRLCSIAISKGLEFGAKVATVSTTGNHGASTAAYAAVAGMDAVIFAHPLISETMFSFMRAYGAKVVPVSTEEGRLFLMNKCVNELGWYPTGTFSRPMPTGNPYGTQGHKTIAYEVIEQLNFNVPDYVIVPTANGEGLYGIWAGFNDYYRLGFIDRVPRMVAAETEMGPLANALKKGINYVEKVSAKESIALSIAGNISSYQALRAIRDSDGLAQPVSDSEIVNAIYLLARYEGIFPEAASAASLATTIRLIEDGKVERDAVIVTVITSAGLKDTRPLSWKTPPPIEPQWENFTSFLKQYYNYTII
ncbi:MAG: threonine synthase [Desulfurococcaceae archaeon]